MEAFGFDSVQVALVPVDQGRLQKSGAMGFVAREENNHASPAVSSKLVPVHGIAPPPNRIMRPSNFEYQGLFFGEKSLHSSDSMLKHCTSRQVRLRRLKFDGSQSLALVHETSERFRYVGSLYCCRTRSLWGLLQGYHDCIRRSRMFFPRIRCVRLLGIGLFNLRDFVEVHVVLTEGFVCLFKVQTRSIAVTREKLEKFFIDTVLLCNHGNEPKIILQGLAICIESLWSLRLFGILKVWGLYR